MGARLNRRQLLARLASLSAGLGAAWWLRERYLHPRPEIIFSGGLEDSGWIALPYPGSLVEVTVLLSGVPIRAVVDSGAQFSAIDRGLAERLGLQPALLPMLAFGVSGQPSLTHAVSLDFSVGPMQVRGSKAATLELLRLSWAIRRPIAMLLGRDVLQSVALDIDWPAGRMRFVRPEAYRPPPGAVAALVKLDGGALMAPVAVEEAAPLDLLVDTGATSEIALSQESAQTLGLLDGRPVTTGRSISLGGLSEDRVVRARVVEFAGRTLRDVEIQIFRPSVRGPLPAGLLGVGILKRYRVGLDLSAGHLWLSPSARPNLKRSR